MIAKYSTRFWAKHGITMWVESDKSVCKIKTADMCRNPILAIHRPVDEPLLTHILYTALVLKSYPYLQGER